ncbi:BlaI/MecI/CopY family transcriptional regulator [Candidatus Sumerlaeota bacterium]|nr:BlaI/MecI/CopY family transcriptional regulator [Candidatus Sumerlaeota bacterium]
MMAEKLPRPTNAELAILKAIWEQGPSTVRQVHEALDDSSAKSYTTTLKLMQIMAEKGLLVRDESQRTHVYQASRPAEKTQRQLLTDLADRAFGGSTCNLVMNALASSKASAEELREIRQLIDQLDKEIQP